MADTIDNLPMRDDHLRSVTHDDEPALIELFAKVFGVQRSSAEWRWKFVASRALARDFTPVESMVALDPSGMIIAHAGALCLPGVFRGKRTPFVQICDVMVHPSYRGGIGQNNLFTVLLRSLLSKIATDLPTAFRYGFPGRGPYLVGERAGVYGLMEVALKADVPAKGPLSASFWRVVPLSWGDDRLDVLWGRLRKSFTLGLVRDAAYLRWRYADNPVRSYELFGLARFGRLQGWVVSCCEQGERRLVDLLLPPASIRAAIHAVARHVGANRAPEPLSVWLPHAWRSRLDLPMLETPVFAANMCWRSAIDTATAREHLYYTMGDVDIY
ncbi:GNAT family N-acetyltransferase [Thiocystis violacea]|uniref:GNAT family N-acetyltransferase n=1 Tax=Thiocystis violacea TaxID=13725 RepID=UPI001905E48A|nr:GNAT family N-acetyltransferase [Thiocystis violacea]